MSHPSAPVAVAQLDASSPDVNAQREREKLDSLGRLAGGIAHDFNNLLTAIVGHTELVLESRALADEDRQQLEQVQQASQRAAALTQQLLAYSRKQVLAPRTVDVNELIGALHGMLSRIVREDISIVWRPSLQPAIVRADPAQLEQVVTNLVLNARDAIPAEGTIRIEASKICAAEVSLPPDVQSRAHEYVRLRISDNGVGISSEARAHLFEPFYPATDPGRSGRGMGLASVYGIVRQSNGFIDVESELGAGSVFTLHFPAVSSDAAAERNPMRDTVPPTRETVLIVEDEDAVRAVASIILKRDGYRVLEASTPGLACEIFAERGDEIDLLLTDVVMPEMNGPGLAQRLVAERPQLRVVFMSGYVDISSPFDTTNVNIAFVNKPFRPAALLDKVREVLNRPRTRRD
ncbi:MAG TPA: ATP-binding protein [Vicinamibacterales bacterium]|jgi:nitrogen-specific signal transduction histidine kinase/CheY-like chemotaxis protein|nr:ATP-binding protein [Vicinamibacterales bacterium]